MIIFKRIIQHILVLLFGIFGGICLSRGTFRLLIVYLVQPLREVNPNIKSWVVGPQIEVYIWLFVLISTWHLIMYYIKLEEWYNTTKWYDNAIKRVYSALYGNLVWNLIQLLIYILTKISWFDLKAESLILDPNVNWTLLIITVLISIIPGICYVIIPIYLIVLFVKSFTRCNALFKNLY